MNYLMYQQSGDGQFLKVPDGLKELMSDISREVLREQPENIYEFIADYLEEMEITREHRGIAENVLNMVIDDSVTIYELFKESGIALEHAKKSAKIIETSFNEYARNKHMKASDREKSSKIMERDVCRKIMQSCDLTREQDQKLRKIVQMCFKSYYFREKSYKFKLTRLPDSHWANRAEKTLDLYRRTAPEKCKLDRAAVVIQSAYRSYFVRKMPKEIQRFHECASKIQARFRGYMAKKELKRAKAAATKIQAMYRGYSTRKALRNRNENVGVIGYESNIKPFLLVSELVEEMVAKSCADDKDEVPIHLDGSSKEDVAARTIQKVYRGFQERKKVSTKNNDSEMLSPSNQPVLNDNLIELELLNVIESIQDCVEKHTDMK